MSQENVALARRFFDEVWNQRCCDAIGEMLDDDSECLTAGGTAARGAAPFRENWHGPMLAAIPDLRVEVVGTVAEGDQVVVRWMATGTHTGAAPGMAPTGRAISFHGMTWIRYENGRMREGWDCFDQTSLIQILQGK